MVDDISKDVSDVDFTTVISLKIVYCQRETNPRKPMWLMTSPKMCLTLTLLQ